MKYTQDALDSFNDESVLKAHNAPSQIDGFFSPLSIVFLEESLVEDVLRWIQEIGVNEWGALALSKMYGICHEHGMVNILCAMYVIKRYSNSACIDKAIKSIIWSNDDAGDADENVLHWTNKVVHYTFTCQF